ncbi:hypothetical protein V1477_021208 [Vespula maculifrons]|uniref:Uncharacterized protein n=1 Tax=Vespula maculifrons TaxID=7453 RepID=A0ABD2AGJ1_VESMC
MVLDDHHDQYPLAREFVDEEDHILTFNANRILLRIMISIMKLRYTRTRLLKSSIQVDGCYRNSLAMATCCFHTPDD